MGTCRSPAFKETRPWRFKVPDESELACGTMKKKRDCGYVVIHTTKKRPAGRTSALSREGAGRYVCFTQIDD
jgi:hypothetical protein